MQNLVSKFLFFFLTFLLIIPKITVGQEASGQLSLADSLFVQRKYTESLDMYKRIIDTKNEASPAMLLRMAFIHEGLGDLHETLYYLDRYYTMTANKKVLAKMRELATQNSLEGYEKTDIDHLLHFYYRHRYLFIFILLALGVLIISMIYRKKQKHRVLSYGLGIVLVAVLLLAGCLINFSGSNHKGIITGNNAYLMSGPSAGAELIEVTGEGHQVEIMDQIDIWLKIKWKGTPAYIRERNVRELP